MSASRREFVYGMGVLGAFSLFSSDLFSIDRTEPELILYNGSFWTVNPRQPRAQAVAISGGRFLAIGSNDEVLALAAGNAKKIDLGGKTVLPGFIDAHSHPAEAGLSHLRMVDCDLRSIADILKALRERASKTPPGEWVLGFKYDDTKTVEGRPLTRDELDAALPGHPVFVQHRGGHTAWVNSQAIKLAKIDDHTPDPPGGSYDHDPATGRLTGHVRENGRVTFEKIIPSNFTRDDHREGVRLISQMMTRTGITSVTDAMGTPEDLRAYQDAREAGQLKMRAYCHIYQAFMDQMLAAGVKTGLGDDWVKVGAQKMICDGSISERTARLSQPYIGRPDDLMATRDPRQWRCRHRYNAARVRTVAEGTAAQGCSLPAGALHGRQRFADCADQGAGRDSYSFFHLRVLSRREDEGIRTGARESHVRAAQFHRCRNPANPGVGLSAGPV